MGQDGAHAAIRAGLGVESIQSTLGTTPDGRRVSGQKPDNGALLVLSFRGATIDVFVTDEQRDVVVDGLMELGVISGTAAELLRFDDLAQTPLPMEARHVAVCDACVAILAGLPDGFDRAEAAMDAIVTGKPWSECRLNANHVFERACRRMTKAQRRKLHDLISASTAAEKQALGDTLAEKLVRLHTRRTSYAT